MVTKLIDHKWPSENDLYFLVMFAITSFGPWLEIRSSMFDVNQLIIIIKNAIFDDFWFSCTLSLSLSSVVLVHLSIHIFRLGKFGEKFNQNPKNQGLKPNDSFYTNNEYDLNSKDLDNRFWQFIFEPVVVPP